MYAINSFSFNNLLTSQEGGVPIIKMEIQDVFFHEGGESRVPHTYSEK